MNLRISKLKLSYLYTLVGVLVIDLLRYLSFDGIFFAFGTHLSAFIAYTSLFVFFGIASRKDIVIEDKKISFYFKIYLWYLGLNIIRGFFIANTYWEYKFLLLNSFLFTLISFTFYLGKYLSIFKNLVHFYIKRLLFIALIILPFTYFVSPQVFSRLVIAVGPLLLFTPFFKKKWVLFLIGVVILSHWSNMLFRTNIIKTIFSVLILGVYYLNLLRPFFLKIVYFSVLVLPMGIVFLGLTGQYNIFEEFSKTEGYELENRQSGEEYESQTVDTRTFLYAEVIADVIKNNSVLFGKSPSQAYRSYFFYNYGGAMNGMRYRSEVHILNLFLHFGIIGVILYLLFLVRIAYLALFQTKNSLSKMLGLLILTRYMLSFLEEFTQYDLNWYFFWLIMGLVSSKKFRNMTDAEIKYWLSTNPKEKGAIESNIN